MTDDRDLREAFRLLLQRQTLLEAELKEVNAAIESLARVPGLVGSGPVLPPMDDRPSVRQMLIALLDEPPERDWSVGEIISEYRVRGNPIPGTNADNALRAAINEALKAERIERTERGRYKSILWKLGPEKGGAVLG